MNVRRMQHGRWALAAVLLGTQWLAACAPVPSRGQTSAFARSSAASGGEVARPPPSPSSSPAPPSAEEIAVNAALVRIRDVFARERSADLNGAFAAARDAARGSEALLDRVALLESAIHVERGELEPAATLLRARIDAAARAHSLREFGLHDLMIFVCEARGDSLCAYLEAEAMRTVADAPDVPPETRARIRLGYTWQRAHTLRNFAETLQGEARSRAIAYAEEARRAFGELARASHRSLPSIDVLEEQFATLDGHFDAALAAAARLDVNELDSQDRYITLRTFLAAHDEPGVSRIRAAFDADHDVDVLSSVYRLMARH